ncbi:MAG: DUF4382 domain-containing protein [Deltaproteobacteria bacterium]|nr:DUF4382 domain-containing protein [Deltaproteobacteria bacterium]NIS77064.1 DUF4382 domain-containing protein [Deltaproteobacteria bacterium]
MKNRYASLFIVATIIVTGLLACQSGKDGPGGETGSVAILLTDRPTGDFDNIWVTIEKIELISESSKVTLFDKTEKEIRVDLLDLENESSLIFLESGILAGPYSKIRLHVTEIELVNGESIIVEKLLANGKIDLNPRMTFFVDPGQTLVVEVDFDAHNSIHVVETGSSMYLFRPVVFVNIVDEFGEGKIIRASGVVTNREDEGFTLCEIESLGTASTASPVDDLSKCVDVRIASSTFFDDEGSPAGYEDISEGDFVTLFGKVHVGDGGTLGAQESSPPLALDAFVVGRGTLSRADGIIRSALSAGEFPLETSLLGQADDTGIATVQVWDETGIFSKSGQFLASLSITGGTFATVYGIFDPTNSLLLSAEAILIGDSTSPETLSGVISGSTITSEMTFLATDTGIACVTVTEDAQVVTTIQDESGFSINQAGHFEDLQIGDGVTLLGAYDSGIPPCFIADAVFAFRE